MISVFSYLISCLTSSSHECARRPKGDLWLSCMTCITGSPGCWYRVWETECAAFLFYLIHRDWRGKPLLWIYRDLNLCLSPFPNELWIQKNLPAKMLRWIWVSAFKSFSYSSHWKTVLLHLECYTHHQNVFNIQLIINLCKRLEEHSHCFCVFWAFPSNSCHFSGSFVV